MKLNWGTAVVIAMISFMVFILTFVYRSAVMDEYQHELVSEDYYGDELHYQEEIDKLNNASALEVDVTVTCQRCLEPMPQHLSSENTLAVVWTDEQAAHLPRHLDPLILEDEPCRLWDLVEDELILALPAFSYHDTEACNDSMSGYTDPSPKEAAGEEKPNPFEVLAQLKPGTK